MWGHTNLVTDGVVHGAFAPHEIVLPVAVVHIAVRKRLLTTAVPLFDAPLAGVRVAVGVLAPALARPLVPLEPTVVVVAVHVHLVTDADVTALAPLTSHTPHRHHCVTLSAVHDQKAGPDIPVSLVAGLRNLLDHATYIAVVAPPRHKRIKN